MLTVWGRRTSSNVQAVMWGIAELGLTCTRHDVGHRYGGTDTPEFRALNPNGLVPVLRDGDDPPLFESAAILRYLAGRYGGPPFWPAEGVARAQVDKWAEWAKVTVAPVIMGQLFWPLVRTPEAQRDMTAVGRAVDRLEALMDIAEGQLSRHAHLAGDDLTLADVQFGMPLYRMTEMGVLRTARPGLSRYYAALTARPAYREHVMVSYEELRTRD